MDLKVVFRNKAHQKLIGVLSTPEGKEPFPAAILVHGFMANKDMHFFPLLAEKLVGEGFQVLRFDVRGCGESEGKIHATYKEFVEDINSAMLYLKEQHYCEDISLFGHSMGGTAVIVAASKLHARTVVTFGAVGHLQPVLENKKNKCIKKGETYVCQLGSNTAELDKSFFKDLIDPIPVIAQIHAPILIMHSLDDKRVPIADAQELFITASFPKSFKRFADTDHYGNNKFEEIVESVIKFVKNTHSSSES